MRPTPVSKTGAVGVSPVFRPNVAVENFQVGFGVYIEGGSVLTYSVEHTFHNPDDVGAVWFPHATVAAKGANDNGSYLFPVRGIRLNVTAWTSGGATLVPVQSGP